MTGSPITAIASSTSRAAPRPSSACSALARRWCSSAWRCPRTLPRRRRKRRPSRWPRRRETRCLVSGHMVGDIRATSSERLRRAKRAVTRRLQLKLGIQLGPEQHGIDGDVEPHHDADHGAERAVRRVVAGEVADIAREQRRGARTTAAVASAEPGRDPVPLRAVGVTGRSGRAATARASRSPSARAKLTSWSQALLVRRRRRGRSGPPAGRPGRRGRSRRSGWRRSVMAKRDQLEAQEAARSRPPHRRG